MTNSQHIKLRMIRDQARVAREYFKNHDMKADEVTTRLHLEDIEFLLSVIDELAWR